MKQLISATLSPEAAEIYNNWEKQKKSMILSELIVKENQNRDHIIALQTAKGNLQRLISNAMIHIYLNEPKHPLVHELNDVLHGTIYYQYFQNQE